MGAEGRLVAALLVGLVLGLAVLSEMRSATRKRRRVAAERLCATIAQETAILERLPSDSSQAVALRAAVQAKLDAYTGRPLRIKLGWSPFWAVAYLALAGWGVSIFADSSLVLGAWVGFFGTVGLGVVASMIRAWSVVRRNRRALVAAGDNPRVRRGRHGSNSATGEFGSRG